MRVNFIIKNFEEKSSRREWFGIKEVLVFLCYYGLNEMQDHYGSFNYEGFTKCLKNALMKVISKKKKFF